MSSTPSYRFSLSSGKKVIYSIAFLGALSMLNFVPEQTLLTSLSSHVPTDVHQIPFVKQVPTISKQKDNHEEFNYTLFWQDAMTKALESAAKQDTHTPSTSTTCPKVYVYNLTDFNQIDTKNHPRRFGKQSTSDNHLFDPYLRKTNQYAFASILEEKLLNTACRTHDPNAADLFFAPILSAPKGSGGWSSTCKAIDGNDVKRALPFLNSSNACRHFIAVGKGHTDLPFCKGWFSDPIPELAPFYRLSYSSFNFVLDEYGAHSYDPNDKITTTHPNMVSVPYPSSLHYSKDKPVPHFDSIKRRVLMSFIGKDNHGDQKVRQEIHKLCNTYKSRQVCDYRIRFNPKKDATSKAKTVFCLEPAGDTPGRKSLSDSITFGCIPVLFSELTDDVAPWHWLDWKDRARVLVPREEFVAGRIDLQKLLTSIPQDLLELLQTTLKTKSRMFQYSIDDDPGDGVRVILDNLHREVQQKVKDGTCGYPKQ